MWMVLLLVSWLALPSPAPVVTADAGGSYLYINGKQTVQVCGDFGLFYGDNFHSHNCFDTFEPFTVKLGADGSWLIYQPISGLPSGGSIIIERICYQDWYWFVNAHPKPPFPAMPCEISKRYQVFNVAAENVAQADSLDGPLLPVTQFVQFVPPVQTPKEVPTWTPTPISTASAGTPVVPSPTLTVSASATACPDLEPPASPLQFSCLCRTTGQLVPCQTGTGVTATPSPSPSPSPTMRPSLTEPPRPSSTPTPTPTFAASSTPSPAPPPPSRTPAPCLPAQLR